MKTKGTILLLLIVMGLFSGCTQRRMLFAKVLDRAEQQNAEYDSITHLDSIKLAVKFFDIYGSANEQIRAHYLLGCAYRDMGEAPIALESYQDAVNCADTTKLDCDYIQLAKVHSQMANLFYQQMLPYNLLEELEFLYKYAILSNDTIKAINAIELKANAYELLNLPDSIIKIRLSAYKMYNDIGHTKEASLVLGPLLDLFIDAGQIEKAKEYQDIYELESEICKNGKIDKRRTLYNFTKGNYYLAIGKTDSAKIFFYKLLSPDLTANHHEAGYRGLYLLYKKIGQKDSLAKYADMCYQLNDASYASEATEKMQQMQALYNYTRSQKEANEMKAKADRNCLLLLVAIAVLLLVIAIASYFYQKRQKENEILHLQYENAKNNLEKAKRDQRKMEEENSSLLEEKNQEIHTYEQQMREIEAQLRIRRTKATNEELMATPIYKHMKDILTYHKDNMQKNDWKELRNMIDEKIPSFYSETHANKTGLPEKDYDLCILIRLYFTPSEIAALTNLGLSNISMKRIRLLKKIYSLNGTPEDFDKRIQSIY